MVYDPEPIKDILYRMTIRYARVRPLGLEIDGRLLPRAEFRILDFGSARSLYRGRKPVCRSLDAIKSLKGKLCEQCHDKKHCTSQVRIDFLLDGNTHRLLLAYSSAKNFLLYVSSIREAGKAINEIDTSVTVVNRDTWGELRFAAS